jgi:hypothetical protein
MEAQKLGDFLRDPARKSQRARRWTVSYFLRKATGLTSETTQACANTTFPRCKLPIQRRRAPNASANLTAGNRVETVTAIGYARTGEFAEQVRGHLLRPRDPPRHNHVAPADWTRPLLLDPAHYMQRP